MEYSVSNQLAAFLSDRNESSKSKFCVLDSSLLCIHFFPWLLSALVFYPVLFVLPPVVMSYQGLFEIAEPIGLHKAFCHQGLIGFS